MVLLRHQTEFPFSKYLPPTQRGPYSNSLNQEFIQVYSTFLKVKQVFASSIYDCKISSFLHITYSYQLCSPYKRQEKSNARVDKFYVSFTTLRLISSNFWVHFDDEKCTLANSFPSL